MARIIANGMVYGFRFARLQSSAEITEDQVGAIVKSILSPKNSS